MSSERITPYERRRLQEVAEGVLRACGTDGIAELAQHTLRTLHFQSWEVYKVENARVKKQRDDLLDTLRVIANFAPVEDPDDPRTELGLYMHIAECLKSIAREAVAAFENQDCTKRGARNE